MYTTFRSQAAQRKALELETKRMEMEAKRRHFEQEQKVCAYMCGFFSVCACVRDHLVCVCVCVYTQMHTHTHIQTHATATTCQVMFTRKRE